MKAIILAGGTAKRLKPITLNLPKCLLNVGGETIIDRQIKSLLREGVEKIVVVTGFKSELLEQHIALHHKGRPITIRKNEKFESTGPAYGLWCAREYLGQDNIIYLNGDLVCDHNVIKDVIESPKSSLTALSRQPWDEEQVKIAINSDRSIKALGKWLQPEKSLGEFVGATKISRNFGQILKEVLEKFVKVGEEKKIAADALHQVLSREPMYIHDVSHYRTIEIDTISDFDTASKMWRKNTLGRISTLLKIILARILRLVSYLTPRLNGKAIFIGWHKDKNREIFADNAKYLFLHAHKTRGSIRPIWISHSRDTSNMLISRGFEAYYLYSLAGIYHSLTTNFTIIDAFIQRANWQFVGRSLIIQLWHGKGMKQSGLAHKNIGLKSHLISPEIFQKFDLIIASSPYTARLMAEIFNTPSRKVVSSGLPRNDVLFGNIDGAYIDIDEQYNQVLQKFKTSGAKKIIGYMPTFRRSSSNPLDQLDLNKLNTVLKKKDHRMIITLHPKFASRDYETNGLDNIEIMTAGYDVYPFLKDIDILITDYSSLYVDYLLLDRPMIFYTYDRERYQEETGLYEDFDSLTPGPHVKTFEELLDIIKSYNDKEWQKERKEVIDKLHAYKNGRASERVMKAIEELL